VRFIYPVGGILALYFCSIHHAILIFVGEILGNIYHITTFISSLSKVICGALAVCFYLIVEQKTRGGTVIIFMSFDSLWVQL